MGNGLSGIDDSFRVLLLSDHGLTGWSWVPSDVEGAVIRLEEFKEQLEYFGNLAQRAQRTLLSNILSNAGSKAFCEKYGFDGCVATAIALRQVVLKIPAKLVHPLDSFGYQVQQLPGLKKVDIETVNQDLVKVFERSPKSKNRPGSRRPRKKRKKRPAKLQKATQKKTAVKEKTIVNRWACMDALQCVQKQNQLSLMETSLSSCRRSVGARRVVFNKGWCVFSVYSFYHLVNIPLIVFSRVSPDHSPHFVTYISFKGSIANCTIKYPPSAIAYGRTISLYFAPSF